MESKEDSFKMNIVKAKKEELRARKLLKRSNVGIKKKTTKHQKVKLRKNKEIEMEEARQINKQTKRDVEML